MESGEIFSRLKAMRKSYVKFSWFDKMTLYSFWIVVAFGLLVGYWKTFDAKFPLEMKSMNSTYAYVLPGDPLIIRRHGCVKRNREIIVKRKISDTIEYTLPDTESFTNDFTLFKPGKCFLVEVSFIVPKLPEGQTYIYKSELESKINPLLKMRVQLDDYPFTMIDPSDPVQLALRDDYLAYVQELLEKYRSDEHDTGDGVTYLSAEDTPEGFHGVYVYKEIDD